MSCRDTFGTILLAAATALGAAACSAPSDKAPELQTKTPEQAVNQPITVSGCLRAGVASDTFVLNTGKTEGSFDAATYQLQPKEGVELRNYAGREVEVSGTLRSEQTVATTGKVEEQPSKGAAGTPTVETKSELNVRKLDIASVKPTGNKCAEK